MFISFEGIDGSGKSTQAKLLANALRQHGWEVVEVREPGGTPLGEQVRTLLLNPAVEVDPRAELMLFSAARAQLVSHVIEPALERGAAVIADRFFDSSTAYQGGGREVARPEWLQDLHHFVTNGRVPDRTYFIDIDLDTAEGRRGARSSDRMEESGREFYQRVQETYNDLSTLERVVWLDGHTSVDQLHRLILDDVESQLL